MKLLVTIFVLILTAQSFAAIDHPEDRRRADRAAENRRRNEDNRRSRENGDVNIFDISNTLLLTSITTDEKTEAAQVINDSQDFIQSGNLSVLLNQKLNEVQKDNQDLSLEDALDLIVESAKTKL
jgi:hypothetical protein